ncbi:MAG: ferredoxin [Candidatus Omnitrophica bacterium]|nr:ferredoxin [Candidatus Omnitrophota bacterium]
MKKLLVDYEICHRCPKCVVSCSYFFHPGNNGLTALREEIAYSLICRRCENHPCVQACPNGALKEQEGTVRRSPLLCVSCKSCSLACPFGTILPELLPYLKDRCDLCRESRLEDKQRFVCVNTCPYGALRLVEEEEIKEMKNLQLVNNTLVVKAVDWLALYGVKKL